MVNVKTNTKTMQSIENKEFSIVIRSQDEKSVYDQINSMLYNHTETFSNSTHYNDSEKPMLFFDIVDMHDLDISLQQSLAMWLIGADLTKPQRALDHELKITISEASDICDQVENIKNYRGNESAEEKLSSLENIKDNISVCGDRLNDLKRKIKRLANYHKNDEGTFICDFYINALESISIALYSLSYPQTEVRCLIIESEFEVKTGKPLHQQTFRSDETGFDVVDNATKKMILLFSTATLTIHDMRDGHKSNYHTYSGIADALLSVENNLRFSFRDYPTLTESSRYLLSVWVNRMIEIMEVD